MKTFFAFEGIDGSGKSSQMTLLRKRMEAEGKECYITREPTEGEVGKLIRSVLAGQKSVDYRVLAPLFVADRLDHLLKEDNGVLSLLEQGKVVLTDRYYFSSYAYHSVDMDMEEVISLNKMAADLLRPTATIFIDVPPSVALSRLEYRGEALEIFETRSRLEETYENYMTAFRRLSTDEQVLIIDGTGSREEVAELVYYAVAPFLDS